MGNVIIKENERVDDLHRNGYKIIQNTKNFCFGMDAVLLSGFVKVKKNECAIDLGTGTGIIPILMESKTEGKHFIGIDIQEQSVEMANRSVIMNNLEEKILIEVADIKTVYEKYKKCSFDVVTSNPPYMNEGGGLVNDYSPKAIARHEILCSLDDVVKSAERLLKFGGRFYMVHRPHRLTDIFITLRKYKLEPKNMRFVQSYENKEPNMVLIEAVNGAKPMLKIAPPLIIYNEDGSYTDEVYDIYYN